MTIVTEACRRVRSGEACPGSITYDVADRYNGGLEFCEVCGTGHEWDGRRGSWRLRDDLRLAHLERD